MATKKKSDGGKASAALNKDANDLARRLCIVEPMEGGRTTDEVHYLIGSWNELGTTD